MSSAHAGDNGVTYRFPAHDPHVEHFSGGEEDSVHQHSVSNTPVLNPFEARAIARRRRVRLQWRITLFATILLAIASLFLPWSCLSNPSNQMCIGPLSQDYYAWATPNASGVGSLQPFLMDLCASDTTVLITGVTVAIVFLVFAFMVHALQKVGVLMCRALGMIPFLFSFVFSFFLLLLCIFLWVYSNGCPQKIDDYVTEVMLEEGAWYEGGGVRKSLYVGFYTCLIATLGSVTLFVLTIVHAQFIDNSDNQQDRQEFAALRRALAFCLPNNAALI
jgi:hypothetical protein